MFFNRMKHFGRTTKRRCDRRSSNLQVEGLERRRLLVGDLEAIAGDSNLDGQFNSSDLVQVFQQGKFETAQSASWTDGDWNGDTRFASNDLVFAFQLSSYGEVSAPLTSSSPSTIQAAAIDATTDDSTIQDETPPADLDDAGGEADSSEDGDLEDDADDDGNCEAGEHGVRILNRLRGVGVQRIINQLKDVLAEQGDLPGNLSSEEVQKLIDDLTSALTNGDKDALGNLLKTLQQEKLEDRLQGAINQLTDRLTDGNLPGNMTAEELQKTIDELTAALSAGDLDGAQKILKDLRQSIAEDHQQDQLADRLQAQIDRLKEGIAANDPPGDLSVADAQRLLDALLAAQTSGDLSGVHDLQFTMRVEKVITKLNAAITEGTSIPYGLTKEAAEALVKGLQDALAAGNLDAARTLLNDLHASADSHDHLHTAPGPKPGRGEHRPGVLGRVLRGRGPHHHEDAPEEDETDEEATDDQDATNESPTDPVDDLPSPHPAPPAGFLQAMMQRVARRRGR